MDGVWKEYVCAYCGELNETLIDPTSGQKQSFVEDCAVCCRPNVLNVHVDPTAGSIIVDAVIEE